MNSFGFGKKTALVAVIFAFASAFLFAKDNPVKGKSYVGDIMGIEALSVEFVTDSSCDVKVISDMGSNGMPVFETQKGEYSYNSNSTVSITIDGQTLDFIYNAAKDVLSVEMDGIKVQLVSSAAKNAAKSIPVPSTLKGKTFVGDVMGITAVYLQFTTEKDCILKAATDMGANGKMNFEEQKATYSYNKNTRKISITVDGETEEFEFDSARGGIVMNMGGMSLVLKEE